jgi:valyl-tRNA synthetase
VEVATNEFEQYEYAIAMHRTEQAFYALFCDNYLEITKTRAYNEDGKDKEGSMSAILTLYHSLKIFLQLFAPIMPHITEELYQILYEGEGSVHKTGNWPNIEGAKFTEVNMRESESLVDILDLVRKIKAQDNLSIKAPISIIEVKGEKLSKNLLQDLKNVTSADQIHFVEKLSSGEQNLSINDLSINVVYKKD